MSVPDTPVVAETPVKPTTTAATGAAPVPAVPVSVVLSALGLSVWYGTSLALRDVTIEIPRNRITALIGQMTVEEKCCPTESPFVSQ